MEDTDDGKITIDERKRKSKYRYRWRFLSETEAPNNEMFEDQRLEIKDGDKCKEN